MKRAILALIVAFCLPAVATLLNSIQPVRVAVLDSPVDFVHPEIQPVLDSDLMNQIKFVNASGEERSWHDINEDVKKQFEDRVNHNMYDDQIAFLNAINALTANLSHLTPQKRLQILKTVFKGLTRYFFSSEFRNGVNLVGGYVHGTHVAGVTIAGLTDVKLITFPLVKPPKDSKLSELLNQDEEADRRQIRLQNEQMTKAFQESNVRVVNLSIEFTMKSAKKRLLGNLNLLQKIAAKTFLRSKITKSIESALKLYKEEFENLVAANPNVVFVMGAGNGKLDLRKSEMHSAQITADNLIQVASIDRQGKRSKFSNFSPEHIEIAAVGQGVLGALVGGGQIYLSGTSMATPKVSNALLRVFANAPELNATEALAELYKSYSVEDSKLADITINGRRLVESNGSAKKLTSDDGKDNTLVIEIRNKNDLGAELFLAIEEFSNSEVPSQNIEVRVKGEFHTRLSLNRSDKGKVEMTIHDGESADCIASLTAPKNNTPSN